MDSKVNNLSIENPLASPVRTYAGLSGKFDNVRRKWEDELIKDMLSPYIQKIIENKRSKLERIRVMDMGCGNGEAYELLTATKNVGSKVLFHSDVLIEPEMLSVYYGVDSVNNNIKQGKEIYKNNGKVVFNQADLGESFPVEKDEPPFDVYISTYGTLSHLNDMQLESLLINIAKHASSESLVVVDVLGKYSCEWPNRWQSSPTSEMKMEDYTVSYFGDDWSSQNKSSEHFTMRYWTREELDKLITSANKKAGKKLTPLTYYDRSIFVGRHMDTQEYNAYVRPLRKAVNMLFENDVQTDFSSLIMDYVPVSGFGRENKFFERLQVAWNSLIRFTAEKLEKPSEKTLPDGIDEMIEPMSSALKLMDCVIDSASWMQTGDARANIIEPQLAYALRNLESNFQMGLGLAHNLMCIIEVA